MSYCNYWEARLVSQSTCGAAWTLATSVWGRMRISHGCAATSDLAGTGASPGQMHFFEALCTKAAP